MIRATRILRRDALSGGEIVDRVVLDHGDRHRRRVAMRGAGGLGFLLDLPEPAVLEDGDALVLQDGRLVWVEAAPERLLEIRAPDDHALKRLIWHIGNRHIPAEIGADAVWIADDHVLAEMVRGLGGTAEPVERPFRPEGGAYSGGHAHEHDHPHGGHHHHHHAGG
ncbi:MAG: urease accessory protein UreE [Cupriavidus sp.]|jgi:urease accessory protein|uniref:urease accessory protein UreE n=1 Tax=Methylobacterium TaxID=407 RepID=UPI0006ADB1B7|nr:MULTISPECIES: urease accessory protein UreE [Methylobacterium]KOX44761.1 urease accessory protein UreE [Streptomyces purpurogeneiscleroticus]MBU69387.1 urease accessory protein UreE [Cupriavidus sp.]MBP30832.1 urease accessory protein UreE [Methylobacterium sp.]MDH3028063.1 urease accessory protein UreE [Methylobacterium fujisawaense]RUP15621.1 MAG: urease accessory protein UreE [Methylobacterium sp.]